MSTIEEKRSLENAIWITSKVRTLAESKRRRFHYILWLIAFCYGFSALIADLFRDFLTFSSPVGMTFTLVGLCLMIASLRLNYSSVADQFRECYLELDKLMNLPCEDMPKRYSDILDKYPNHTPSDYEDFLVYANLKGNSISDSRGNPIKPTTIMWFSWAFRKVFVASIVATSALIPLMCLYIASIS